MVSACCSFDIIISAFFFPSTMSSYVRNFFMAVGQSGSSYVKICYISNFSFLSQNSVNFGGPETVDL